ncbi:hypothetical protein KV697_01400 [Sphingomonas sanguinis]|uniref:hypothetical protein n=1 Tax=Sphingomonas sanguinis TaxID=33051 RepID=UPI001C5640E8|nr:hypothetical protein [Sphingomonas sanguinis]QXT36070.1 hypothetical protein KV697_01400 [Sphingomonas sanguinis]
MRLATILYALFCLAVVALFALATMRGYSPFAESGTGTSHGGGGVRGAHGPTHK